MKKTLLGLLLTFNLYANIEVSQNIRALYKGVKLTKKQKNYILDNQDYNINQLTKTLKKELKNKKPKYINEKNVISFILTPDGNITNINFLEKSNNHRINTITKKAIKKNANKFIKPKEITTIRFIIHYNKNQKYIKYENQSTTSEKKEPYYQNIPRGTTRFEYSSKEYVRTFEINEDEFVNATADNTCATLSLLTYKNQRIMSNYNPWSFNTALKKGRYKLLIKTKKTCDVNIQY